MKDERTRGQCLAHGRLILEHAVEELRTSTPAVGGYGLAHEIGASRAVGGVHPSESLGAAAVLLASALRALTPRLTGEHAAAQTALLATTLHVVLTRALQAAADSYAGMLLNQVHHAHVEERRRLSRELHDRIGHGISVAKHSLELYEIYRDSDPERAAARMRTGQEALGQTIDVVRQVISDLRLVEPVESLEKAVQLFLEQATTPDLECQVEVNGDEAWASEDVVEEVFLIVREALRNVIAHAQAGQARVRIDIAPSELRATVVDNGRGFDTNGRPRGGTGVLSMRERAAMLGGNLTLTSRPGHGTRIDLSVPLAEDGAPWTLA